MNIYIGACPNRHAGEEGNMRTKGKLRKLLSTAMALVFLLALLPVGAQAAEIVESGSCGNGLTWTLDDEGTLTISGSGKIADYGLQDVACSACTSPRP